MKYKIGNKTRFEIKSIREQDPKTGYGFYKKDFEEGKKLFHEFINGLEKKTKIN